MQQNGEKLLLFGGKPSGYLRDWQITDDLALAERKLGLRFEEVPDELLRARYESLDERERAEASRLAQDLVTGASLRHPRGMPPAPPQPEIEKAARLYVVMRGIAEERLAQAVTSTCWPWIRGEGLPTPCLALMLFQEQGVPAACQGDIDALLTMVLLKRVAGVPSFMGGPVERQGHLGISHCVLCRNIAGAEARLPYLISNYHGRKDSPTVWVQPPLGQTVTLARLTKDLERLLLLTGTVVANEGGKDYCRNTLVIQVPDRARVLQAVKGIQNHYVVAYGDHTPALTELAEAKGIAVVRLDLPT